MVFLKKIGRIFLFLAFFYAVLAVAPFAKTVFAKGAVSVGSGLMAGDVIRSTDSGPAYVINEFGYKRIFLGSTFFGFYYYDGHFGRVQRVDPQVITAFITSNIVQDCEGLDTPLYVIELTDTGHIRFHHVAMSTKEVLILGQDFSHKIFCVSVNEISRYAGAGTPSLAQKITSYFLRTKATYATPQTGLRRRYLNFDGNDILTLPASALASLTAGTLEVWGRWTGPLPVPVPVSNPQDWHHIAIVIQSGQLTSTVYVDGVLLSPNPRLFNPDSLSIFLSHGAHGRYKIGRAQSGRYFQGDLDDFRVWGRVLTQSEVQASMGQELTGNEAGLLDYWKFNEGSGQTALDSTSQAAHLTLGSTTERDTDDPHWVTLPDEEVTPTPTPSATVGTATPTPLPSTTATPTSIPTSTSTVSPTPTISLTPSPTVSVSVTPTPTATTSQTPTVTPTPSPTPSPTDTASLNPTDTPSATPTPTPEPSPGSTQLIPSCVLTISPATGNPGSEMVTTWTSSNDADGNIPMVCSGSVVARVLFSSSGSLSNVRPADSQLCTLTITTSQGVSAGCSASISVQPVSTTHAVSVDISPATLAPTDLPLSFYNLREGDVIGARSSGDPDVYIVNEYGYKRLFLNPEIFYFYGHLGGFAGVKDVSPETRDSFPTSGLFRNCETNEARAYGVEVSSEDDGVLHWVDVTGTQATSQDPDFFKKVFCINTREFNWYPKGYLYNSVRQIPDYSRFHR